MQVRGTPKNFQGVERKKKTTPAVRRAPSAQNNFQGAERQKQFTPAERRAPSAHFSEGGSIPPKSFPLGCFCSKKSRQKCLFGTMNLFTGTKNSRVFLV